MFQIFQPFAIFRPFSAPNQRPSLFARVKKFAAAIYDIQDLSTLFQDAAGTTPAAVGDPVGLVLDKSGNGYHATQSVSAARPTLAQDANGTYYLAHDGIDDGLSATLPDLGTDAYWAFGGHNGVQISQAPNTAGTHKLPIIHGAERIVIADSLTTKQRADMLSYLKGTEYALIGTTNYTTIFSRIDSSNGPYELTFIGVNGVVFTTTANNTTVDVGAEGLTAPIVMLVPAAVINDTALTVWNCNSSQLTGTITDISANTALTVWNCLNNQLTGTIPDLSANTALLRWYCGGNQLTGTIPDLSANTTLTLFHCYSNQLTGWAGGTISADCTNFQAQNNALDQAAVDGILQALDAAGASNGTLNLESGTNAAPSAAGLTAKSNLEARDWAVTVNS